MAEDEIARIVRAVLRVANADLTAATRAELHIRQQWGGDRIYVAKSPAKAKTWSLAESLAAGRQLNEARNQLGISRPSMYRYLRRTLR